ncbi:putative manganese-dependent inorganic diphosphatase [Erysipelothrix rhusiopathiae]|uniref:putative manganese-dependent inorganic diphosphatase n=1 Tax=Erysipelothrix rhusiopathiae TaxID=1648 RepID=UPI002B240C0B|nr:putative manganese-dependent inorganic diphosphatase [Erysipelothrix rhusiopathiae]WRB92780.1 putative manganese-dependent inorganic diphosphatase [Erysipelothrix rhusiopathiae]
MKNEKDLIYICGHRHPDTDSIVSSIAYAHLKNILGAPAVPCRLGELSDETKYLLDRFGFETPTLLKDARATLDEIEMDDAVKIHLDTSIKEAMEIISDKRQTLAVVDDRDQLIGLVTSSNLAHIAMGDTKHSIALLKKTPMCNIAQAIDGELIYEPKDFHFNGKTSIIAISKTKLDNYELTDRLVIIGNDTESQLTAIRKGASCIVTVWTDEIEESVLSLAKLHDCGIIRSTHGTMNTSRYLLFAPSVREVMSTDLITFNWNEFVDDVGKRMLKTRYRAYPVLDDQNKIYGFVSRYHILNSSSKKMILVDHNEASQSVDGIQQAEILEIIDHHRIGDLRTVKPIYFRNEIIGSTASIITKMYLEHGVEIPKDIASLLLAALVSDTLNLKSPTTTPKDFEIANILQDRSGLDRNEFARDMYEVTSGLKNKPYEDIINQDIKKFYISQKEVMVSQLVIYHFDELDDILDSFEEVMEQFVAQHHLDLLVVVFTSVEDNGSIIVASGSLKEAVLDAFPNKDGEARTFLQDVVSRKNQIIPRLSAAISQYLGTGM